MNSENISQSDVCVPLVCNSFVFLVTSPIAGRGGERQKKNENEGNERGKWNKKIHDRRPTKELIYVDKKIRTRNNKTR